MKNSNKSKVEKKNKKNKNVIANTSNSSYSSIIRMIIIVLIVFFSFYLLTIILLNKNDDKKDKKEVEIQYEEILAGSTFSMKHDKYYVVFYDKTDEELNDLSSAVSQYEAKKVESIVYTVDMGNKLNQSVISHNTINKKPLDATELTIDGPTILKIKDGKVVDYIYGKEKCLHFLNN